MSKKWPSISRIYTYLLFFFQQLFAISIIFHIFVTIFDKCLSSGVDMDLTAGWDGM